MKRFLVISFFSFFLFSGSIVFSQESKPVPPNGNKTNPEATAKLLDQKMPDNTEVSVDEIKKLIALGADLKASNGAGDTALHIYAAALNIDVVKYLVEQGADVKAKNLVGQNPAFYAVARNINAIRRSRIVVVNGENLLPNKDKDNKDNKETIKKLSEVIKLLVDKGADAFEDDQTGKNLITTYLQRHYGVNVDNDLLKSILNKDNINKQDRMKTSPLHAAISSKAEFKLLKYMCEDCKADTNLTNQSGSTPLHLAINAPDLEIISLLIRNGADVHLANRYNKTPIQLLIESNANIANKELIKEIITKNKIDVSDIYKGVDSPLHNVMIQRVNPSRIKYFVELGVSINSRNRANQTPLHIALTLQQNQGENITYLIDNGADVNAQDDNDRTPLHYAAASEFDTTDFIKILIEKKADINAKNKDGQTALMELLKSRKQNDQKIQLLKYLIDNKAEVKITDKNLSTPLHILMESRILQEDIIKFLVEKGIDINAKNNDGQTALLYLMELFLSVQGAANQHNFISQKDCRDMIKLFTQLGADVGIKDNKNQTVFHAVVKGEVIAEPEIIKELVKHGNDIDWSKEENLSPVCWALSIKADHKVIEYFHKTKANFKKNNKVGDSPMYLFLLRECNDKQGEISLEKIKFLVECGADINDGMIARHPFLYLLRRCKPNLETVKYLVEKGGANIRVKDDQGIGVLHSLIMPSQYKSLNLYDSEIPDIVKYFVERGADTESQENLESSRPIHHAALMGSLKIVKYLTEQKVQVNVKTSNGDTPLHYATRCLIKDNLIKNNLIKFLIQNGCSVNEKNNDHVTPLIDATKNVMTDLNTIKYLCEEAKAKLNVKDKDGNTPLLSAIKFVKDAEIITYLIKSGANTKSIDNEGRNSLHCLCAKIKPNSSHSRIASLIMDNMEIVPLKNQNHKGLSDLITLLVDSGVDINLFDKKGMTPLLYAISSDNDNVEFISHLIQKGAEVGVKNSDGQSVILLYLIQSRDETNVKKIMELLKINFTDQKYKTLLHEIINTNELNQGIAENIKLLVKSGYPINSQDRFGSTPLHIAVVKNNINVINNLIDNGANINAKDNNNATPLHDASERCKDPNILEILIKAGADVNAKDIFNMTPLDLVSIENNDAKSTILRKAMKKNNQ